jgi:hypothetical protein
MMTMPRVTDWSRAFDEPIPLPKGKTLAPLRAAALYITELLPLDSFAMLEGKRSKVLARRAWLNCRELHQRTTSRTLRTLVLCIEHAFPQLGALSSPVTQPRTLDSIGSLEIIIV